MKKNVSITAALVVALFAGLAPVGNAQAAPFSQMRLPGNFSQRFTRMPVTVLNAQKRFGNLSGKLLPSPTLRSIGIFQTTRIPVLNQIARIASPSLTGNLRRFSSSIDGPILRPSKSIYEIALQTIPGISGGNHNGNGGRGGKSCDDADDREEENEKNTGRRGGKSGRGADSGTPPNPPRLYNYVDADDDDDENK